MTLKQQRINADVVIDLLTKEATALLHRHGEDKKTALKSATAFIMRFLEVAGGCQIYFPKFDNLKAVQKNRQIQEQYKHSTESIKELARRHTITTVQAYNIIKSCSDMTGGNRIESHWLIETLAIEVTRMLLVIGIETQEAINHARGFAAVVVAHFAGRVIYLPSSRQFKLKQRAFTILKLYAQGFTVQQIAVKFSITDCAVYQNIRKNNTISCKKSLFDSS